MFNPITLMSGAISEIREAFAHVTSVTEAEFQKDRSRLEILEAKAEGMVTKAIADVKADLGAAVADVRIEAKHVGMSFKELFEAVTHPMKAGAALIDSEEKKT